MVKFSIQLNRGCWLPHVCKIRLWWQNCFAAGETRFQTRPVSIGLREYNILQRRMASAIHYNVGEVAFHSCRSVVDVNAFGLQFIAFSEFTNNGYVRASPHGPYTVKKAQGQ